jgi:flagellar hook-associated protein 2
MGTIISSGAGSGLDVSGLVAKLVEAEGAPQNQRLNVQEAKLQGKVSALATLRSALSNFQGVIEQLESLDAFRGRQVDLSSADFLSVDVDTQADPGSYQVEIERLASTHRLNSQTFATQDAPVGTGTLTLALGANAFTVEIDSTNNTVAGIADAINAAAANTGIGATVINGVDGARLVLSGRETGASNSIVVTAAGGDNGLSVLQYDPANAITDLTELQPAVDARVLIDGFAVESATNTVDSSIAGLTIELLAANQVGETTTVNVGFDRAAASETVGRLVSSYNELVAAVSSVASYNADTGTSGPLAGDVGLRNIVFQLRRELNSQVNGLDGPFSLLQQLGVETTLEGELSLDASRLEEAFNTDFDAVGQMFATEDTGLAHRLGALLDPYLAADGVFDARESSLQSSISDIGDRRAALEVRLTAVEARLLRQFNALDGLLAQLEGTSNYLAQQLSNLPGFTFNQNN